MPFVTTWMDLEDIMLSEHKSEKNKHCMISLICGILKEQTNRVIDTENKQVVARGEEGGGLREIGEGN